MTTDRIPPAIDGATTALQRQVKELTAELAEKSALLTAETRAFAEMRATERAAREQAEELAEARGHSWQACVDKLEQAERERDTALARAESAETELAVVRRRGTPSGHVVALEAELLSTLDREKTAECLLGEERLAKVAAETALASARSVAGIEDEAAIGEQIAWGLAEEEIDTIDAGDLRAEYRQLQRGANRLRAMLRLTSRPPPAPAVAPCAGCAAARELVRRAATGVDWNQYDSPVQNQIGRDLYAWLKEHP